MKGNRFVKRIFACMLAAALLATSVPVYAGTPETVDVSFVLDMDSEQEAGQTETEPVEENTKRETAGIENIAKEGEAVSENEVEPEKLPGDGKCTEDSFFGYRLNFISEEENRRQIEELKKSGLEVIDLDDLDRNDIDADGSIVYDAVPSVTQTYAAKYDPRPAGMVTSVKNQGKWGLCWDYATISTCESVLMKMGLANKNIDLSELHLAYSMYKLNNTENQPDFVSFCKNGYKTINIYDVMQQGYGPVYEAMVPWKEPDNTMQLSDAVLNEHICDLRKCYLTRVNDTQEKINNVKYMVSTYGAANMSVYMGWGPGSGFKAAGSATADNSLYCATSKGGTNHALSVVGWDDNYPATNFQTTAPGNGAWLLKNSYGTDDFFYGTGYVWVSYYDKSIQSSVIITPVFARRDSIPKDFSVSVKGTDPVWANGKIGVTLEAVTDPVSADVLLEWNESGESTSERRYFYVPELVYSEKEGTEYRDVKCKLVGDNFYFGSELRYDTVRTARVEVKPLPVIKLPDEEINIKVGEKVVITPNVCGNIPDNYIKKFTGVNASQDLAAAYAQSEGESLKITGYKVGTETITIKDRAKFAKEATLTVHVTKPHITLPEKAITLNVGESYTIDPVIDLPSSGSSVDYTFTSSNDSVAHVDENRVLYADKTGTATITIVDEKGYADPVSLTVKVIYGNKKLTTELEDEITLSMNKGETKKYPLGDVKLENAAGKVTSLSDLKQNISYSVTPSNGYVKVVNNELVIDTSGSSKETVGESGITNKTYTVQISYQGEYSDGQKLTTMTKLDLTLLYPLIQSSYDGKTVTAMEGSWFMIGAHLPDGKGLTHSGEIVYESSDPETARVDEWGTVFIDADKQATVTFWHKDYPERKLKVTVVGLYRYKEIFVDYDSIEATVDGAVSYELNPRLSEEIPVNNVGMVFLENDDEDALYAKDGIVYYKPHTGMKKTVSAKLRLVYMGNYSNARFIYKEIPISITASDTLYEAYNKAAPDPSPTPDPDDPNAPVICRHANAVEYLSAAATEFSDGAYTKYCPDCNTILEGRTIPRVDMNLHLQETYTYTGSQIKPEIHLKDVNGREIARENYTVSYGKNVSGTGWVSVFLQGDYAGSFWHSFTIYRPVYNNNSSNSYQGTSDVKRNTTVKLSKPSVTVKKSGEKIKVTWKKKLKVTGLQIQCSSSKKFAAKKTKTYKVRYNKKSKQFKTVKEGKKCYVRVRAYKKINGRTYYSKWTKVRTVR